jgi:integrase
LRHTSASLGILLGESPREIMERLGHSQISLTMNTYSHIFPVLQREAADRFDERFGG